jgi:hypothetical protein
MKLTKSKFFWIAVVSIVSLAWTAGCGDNVADQPEAVADDGVVAATDGAQAEVDERAAEQEALAQRVAELEAREAELAERERRAARERTESRRRESAPVRTVKRTPPPAEPVVREVPVTLPVSTAFEIEFAQALSSDESLVGDSVRAVVADDVVQDDRVVVPAGTEVTGEVTEVKSGRKIGGRSRLTVEFASLRLPDGRQYPIRSSIEYAGKSQTGKDAATIGGSTAGGALLGRVLGGDNKDKSTAIGAVVGAAVGTAVASKNGTDPVLVQTGDRAELLLYEPLRVTVTETVPAETSAWAKN